MAATKSWVGKSVAVAQVTTVTVGGTLSGETFTISVGGVVIATHTDADTVIATTVAALVAAWNTSTHPYATPITAVDASPDITLTADTAGVPFVITLNTPGGSATLGQASTTANSGPNDWSTAANWSDGVTPVSTDTVIFDAGSVDVLWGLDQNAVTLAELRIMHAYTGKIGLPEDEFTPTAVTIDTTAVEYRETYLKVSATAVRIGEHYGSGSPAGSSRIKLDVGAVVSTMTVSNSASNTADTFLEPIRWLGTHASNVIHMLKGELGIATTAAGEVATVLTLNVGHLGNVAGDATVHVGDGVTLSGFNQSGGTADVESAIVTVNQTAGTLTTIGIGGITSSATVGGTLIAQSSGTINSMLINGTGIADFSRDSRAKTVSSLFMHKGAKLNLDNGAGSALSITLSADIDLVQCAIQDVTIITGDNFTLGMSAI